MPAQPVTVTVTFKAITPQLGGLTLSKTVVDAPEGTDDTFTFNVKLTLKNPEGNIYAYYVTLLMRLLVNDLGYEQSEAEAIVTPLIQALMGTTPVTEFPLDPFTVQLKNGESIVFAETFNGSTYEITEVGTAGYTPSVGAQQGTLGESLTVSGTINGATVEFVNTYDAPSFELDFKTSVSLDDIIGLNAYIGRLPADAVLSEYTAKVYFQGEEQSTTYFTEMTTVVRDGITYYYLRIVNLPAKCMTDEYTVKVFCNDQLAGQKVFSIRGYCETAIASGTISQNTKDLCKAALTYGSEAQKRFEYNLNDLADANITPVALTDIPSTYDIDDSSVTNPDGIAVLRMTASLEAQTYLNLYFQLEAGYNASDFTVTVKKGGSNYGDVTTNEVTIAGENYLYVRISGISAKELGTEFEITVNGTSWNRSVMNFAYLQQSNPRETNVLQAMYQYYLAAKAVLS